CSTTLESIIAGRMDQLTPSQMLTLRVASVIGESFSVDALIAVHPKIHSEEQLARDLHVLEQLDFICADSHPPPLSTPPLLTSSPASSPSPSSLGSEKSALTLALKAAAALSSPPSS